MEILALIYMILGYWATGKTIYANKILIGKWSVIFIQRFILGLFLGWVLIPVALIKTFLGK
ncbi:MAG: hypothetical protein ACI4GV_02040 [Acutalibacteraceae bacterium]